MVRKIAYLCALVCMLSLAGLAEDYPRAVIFGGYQYTHLESSYNASGWNGSLTGNFNEWLGFSADFSGAYKSGANAHSYTFGPVVSARLPVATPFVHALFGGMTLSGGGVSTSGFAMQFGGGVDVGHQRLGLRLIQADWVFTRFSGITSSKNARVSTGIVYHF